MIAALIAALTLGQAAAADTASVGTQYLKRSGGVMTGHLRLIDDKELRLGTGTDYWWVYDATNTRLELNSTDCNGAGLDCVVLFVDDGTDDLDLNGNLLLNIGAAGTDFTSGGGLTLAGTLTPNSSIAMPDAINITFGTVDGSAEGVVKMATAQTPDALHVGVGSESRSMLITERSDLTTDFAHPQQTHPTVYVHTSNTSPVTEYVGIAAAGTHTELFKTLTEGAATSAVQIPVASGSVTSGMFVYTVYAADATNHQARSGRVLYSVVNEAGTETCVLGTVEELDNTPTGTLTATVTCDTTPANAVNVQLNATSSLTQTTLRAYYHVIGAGPGNPLPQ